MKIAWDKKNEIGINFVDVQHERFFDIVNRLMRLSQAKKVDEEKVMMAVYQLAGYANYHFATEEYYFNKYRYPGAADQVKAHARYSSKVMRLMKKMNGDEVDFRALAEEAADFSVRWLTRHLLTEDRRFAEWLKKMKGPAALKKLS